MAQAESDLSRILRLHSLAFGEAAMQSAPVTVLEDQPWCDDPGSVAFRVLLQARDMDFRVSGDAWRGNVLRINSLRQGPEAPSCIIGETYGTPFVWARPASEMCDGSILGEKIFILEDPLPRCHRFERRGTDLTTIVVPCENVQDFSTHDTLNQLVQQLDISVSMTASAMVCRTLTGTGLFESEWTLAVRVSGDEVVFEGSFDRMPWLGRNEDGTEVSLVYETQDQYLWEVSEALKSGPPSFDPMRSGVVGFKLEIADFSLPVDGVPPVTIRADQSFRLEIQ